MKRISAKELDSLLAKIYQDKDYSKSYWINETIEKTEYRDVFEVDSSSLDRSSFAGYGALSYNKVRHQEQVKSVQHKLDLAALLTSHGFDPVIFPINFQQKNIISDGCQNAFFYIKQINKRYIKDLISYLKQGRIALTQFINVITKFTEKGLKYIYNSDIKDVYKDIIFKHLPSVDETRYVKSQIQILISKDDALFAERKYQQANNECYKNIIKLLKDNATKIEDDYSADIKAQLIARRRNAADKDSDEKNNEDAITNYKWLLRIEKNTNKKNRCTTTLRSAILIWVTMTSLCENLMLLKQLIDKILLSGSAML